jgi:hypothetical protein
LLCIASVQWEKDLTKLCHDNDSEFLVKTIENFEEKLHFLSFLVKNGLWKIFGYSYAEKVSCIGK